MQAPAFAAAMNAVGFDLRNVSLIPVQPRPESRESCCQINVKNLQLGEESVFGYSAPFLLGFEGFELACCGVSLL